jgi:plasmid stabilization system protein ParE
MAYTLVWTRAAVSDLEAVVRYVSRDNPVAARALAGRILSRLDDATRLPYSHRVVPEFGDTQIREGISGAYRIVYHVDEHAQTITTLRIWHAARGIPDVPAT